MAISEIPKTVVVAVVSEVAQCLTQGPITTKVSRIEIIGCTTGALYILTCGDADGCTTASYMEDWASVLDAIVTDQADPDAIQVLQNMVDISRDTTEWFRALEIHTNGLVESCMLAQEQVIVPGQPPSRSFTVWCQITATKEFQFYQGPGDEYSLYDRVRPIAAGASYAVHAIRTDSSELMWYGIYVDWDWGTEEESPDFAWLKATDFEITTGDCLAPIRPDVPEDYCQLRPLDNKNSIYAGPGYDFAVIAEFTYVDRMALALYPRAISTTPEIDGHGSTGDWFKVIGPDYTGWIPKENIMWFMTWIGPCLDLPEVTE